MKWFKELSGCLPVGFSVEGDLRYAMNDYGDLLLVEPQDGTIDAIAEQVCPFCRYMSVHHSSDIGTIIEMIGLYRHWTVFNPDSRNVMRICRMEELAGGQIAACTVCSAGLLTIVTYPDQRPTDLMLSRDGVHFSKVLSLQFRYKPSDSGLAVLNGSELVACIYGESGREVVLMDLATSRLVQTLIGHELWVDACSFVPEYHLLVTGGQDQTLRFWRIPSGQLIHTVKEVGQVKQIEWSSHYNILLVLTSSPTSKTMKVLEYEVPINESLLWTWKLDGSRPEVTTCGSWDQHRAQRFAFAPQQNYIVTGQYPGKDERISGAEGTLRFWRIEDLLPR